MIKIRWWIPLSTVVLLAAAASESALVPGPEVAAGYHARVREAAKGLGLNIGAWEGKDCPVPVAATALLNPNVVISRDYVNETTGRRVSLLLVQCTQSRDMDGHFPPNCYPGAGWRLKNSTAETWNAGGQKIPGTEYEFEIATGGEKEQITVRDFFMLPDGKLFATLATFRRSAAHFSIRPYGAAQMQLIFRGETSSEERDACFQEFMTALGPLIKEIRTGATSE